MLTCASVCAPLPQHLAPVWTVRCYEQNRPITAIDANKQYLVVGTAEESNPIMYWRLQVGVALGVEHIQRSGHTYRVPFSSSAGLSSCKGKSSVQQQPVLVRDGREYTVFPGVCACALWGTACIILPYHTDTLTTTPPSISSFPVRTHSSVAPLKDVSSSTT